MNKILTFALIFTFGLSYSQSEKENKGINNDSIFIGNCESGTKRAIKDAENKIYNSYSYGLKIKMEDDWKFDEFYEKYMESKYGIFIIDGGCLITPDSKCYTDKMRAIITEEFGSNIFKKSRERAKELYAKKE